MKISNVSTCFGPIKLNKAFWKAVYGVMLLILVLKPESQLPSKIIFVCFNESPLKIMKNTFYLILKTLLVLGIFKFLPWVFGHVEETA